MKNSALTLGIDLGGTGIKLGLVDPKGTLVSLVKFPTPSSPVPEKVAALIREQARILIRQTSRAVVGVGIGAAGDIDQKRGIIRFSPNLGWKNVPLKALINHHLERPVTVDNDANVAAWAAYVVEAKRRIKNLLCVTLGTGVGGGLVLDGRLYHGATGSAGEIGHITLFPDGVLCKCGNRGCLERYVGARAMSEQARKVLSSGRSSLVARLVKGNPSEIDPFILQKAARRGDRLANELWKQAGERLGIALAGLINVLNPEWIVLSGGLSRAGDLLLAPLKRTIAERAFLVPRAAARIVVSKLDQDLGVVGAGLIAN